MNIETARDFILWFIAIAYAMTFIGLVIFMPARKRMPHVFCCRLSEQEFDTPE